MARGWESKEIESQIDAAEAREQEKLRPKLTPEQMARQARRESLLLDRKRIEGELERARHPRHRAMLQEALAHLDQRLAETE